MLIGMMRLLSASMLDEVNLQWSENAPERTV
jgi:hypothetical protein